MSSDVIATDCRIDESALLLFKYLYLEPKEGWYTFKVLGQREKTDKRDTEEWESTREERDFSQGGQDGRNKFTALACQFHALALPACQPLFLLAPYLEFPFKGIIMFMASPVQDPRTKQKGLCHSHCFYSVVFWTDVQDVGRFLMFAFFISGWSGGFTDTPTPHKGRPRFRLLSFSFCLFSTPCQLANAPALFSLPTSHHSLWLIGLFQKRPGHTKA